MVVALTSRHPYTRRLVQIAGGRRPSTRFVEPGGGLDLLRLPRGSTFHLQWINVGLRSEPMYTVLWRAVKLTVVLAMLRARGTRVVWTAHNLAGKGHASASIDVAVRSVVMLLANQVVVLNLEATEPVLAEVPRRLRSRLAGRFVHVPMPVLGLDHGPTMSIDAARRQLGIAPGQPLLAYLPGANQPNRLEQFGSGGHGFHVLSVERAGTGGLRRTEHGWTYFGRPSNEEYGAILCAADAVVLADDRALASMTLQTAVAYRRPVISPRCPAVAELAALGAAVTIDGPLSPGSVRAALTAVQGRAPEELADACSAFEAAHADEVVGRALERLYWPERGRGRAR